MKRVLGILVLAISLSVSAQEGPKITSAVIAVDRNNDLGEAKKYIDEAAEIIKQKGEGAVKPKSMSKFYYYVGKINMQISNTPDLAAQYPNATDEAFEGYTKLIDYEERIGKKKYTKTAILDLQTVANSYAKLGIDAAGKKDYASAYTYFMKSYDLKKKPYIGVTDTTLLYNASVMAYQAENYTEALARNKQLVEFGYSGLVFSAKNSETGEVDAFGSKRQAEMAVKSGKYTDLTSDGDLRASLILTTARLSLKTGDTTAYNDYIQMGRTKFPGDEALLNEELNIYLQSEQFEKALVNLDQAIVNDPENKLYYYIKGFIQQNSMKDIESAQLSYSKALEIDSMYLDPLYMNGLIYVEEANAIAKEMNALPLNATSKYNKLKKDQAAQFAKALPYFEKARKVSPKDKDTLTALAEVYRKLKMYEEAKQIQEEIANL